MMNGLFTIAGIKLTSNHRQLNVVWHRAYYPCMDYEHPLLRSKIAEQNIADAEANTKKALQNFEAENTENRKAYERFYTNLALFSSGTIALSITHLGHLKNIPDKSVTHPRVLIASWIALMVCLLTSLFCTLFHTHYLHFARLRDYVENLSNQKRIQAEEIDNLVLANNPQEKQSAKEKFVKDTETHRKDKTWAKKREDIFAYLWIGSARAAQVTFVLGIALLTFFAIKNM